MFQTSVFRKTTFTGLLTNFGSFISFAYKLALIKTLVHRIFYICSSWGIFHKNMVELENILKRNSFPPKIISKEIRKYLNGKFSETKIKTEKESNWNYCKLPYIGKFSKSTKEKISDISQKYCKDVIIKISISLFKVASLFSAKDKISPYQRSFVVYLFRSNDCWEFQFVVFF